MKNLIFLDVETTGLNEARDSILEIAMVAVALPTFATVAEFSSVVVPPMWPTVKRNLHERVAAMHAASGLLAELDTGYNVEKLAQGSATHLIEGQAREFVQRYAPQTASFWTPLAGANPDFDRRFLKAGMPKLHAMFHYRNFDVRSVTQLQDWVFGVAHVESPHRALADCYQAIQAVRTFLGLP